VNGMPFSNFGSCIWQDVRKNDGVAMAILRYYSGRNDKAESVMRGAVSKKFRIDNPDDFVSGAYHCLCGIGLLDPYIDKEGVECAKLTAAGRAMLGASK